MGPERMSSRSTSFSPRFETQTGYWGHQRDHSLLEDIGARRDRAAEHLPRRLALSWRGERGHLFEQGIDRPQQIEATRDERGIWWLALQMLLLLSQTELEPILTLQELFLLLGLLLELVYL